LQEGIDLGERMANSIKKEIEYGARKVCIIGTDIYDLSADIIVDAFNKIYDNQVIIGPATDGGYYLIGVCDFKPEIFSDIKWSKSTVLSETIEIIENIGMQYQLLEYLNDVDEYEDIPDEIKNKLNLK
jgi:rSAM/selenodomain-associated transferase 1